MKKKNKQPVFRISFIVDITHHKPIRVVANSFGDCARKVYLFINKLETRESHDIISITRDIDFILV